MKEESESLSEETNFWLNLDLAWLLPTNQIFPQTGSQEAYEIGRKY